VTFGFTGIGRAERMRAHGIVWVSSYDHRQEHLRVFFVYDCFLFLSTSWGYECAGLRFPSTFVVRNRTILVVVWR